MHRASHVCSFSRAGQGLALQEPRPPASKHPGLARRPEAPLPSSRHPRAARSLWCPGYWSRRPDRRRLRRPPRRKIARFWRNCGSAFPRQWLLTPACQLLGLPLQRRTCPLQSRLQRFRRTTRRLDSLKRKGVATTKRKQMTSVPVPAKGQSIPSPSSLLPCNPDMLS